MAASGDRRRRASSSGSLPKQSARLILVNDVNFLLYTPFLPEAAAGTLEPRHVVTPLRDILRRTYLRLGAITGHDPAARTVELRPTTASRSDPLRPVPGRARLGLALAAGPGARRARDRLQEPRRRDLAAQPPDRDARGGERDRGPGRREELLTYVFVGGGYAGLEALAELQDFAADAMDRYPRARLHGMRWILVEAADRVLPEVAAEPRRLRGPRAPRARDRHPPRHPARGGGPPTRSCSRPASGPDPDPGLDRRGEAAPEPRLAGAAARRARAACASTIALRVEGMRRASGRSATAPRSRTRRRRARLPADAQHAVRQGHGGRAQHRRRARRRRRLARFTYSGARRSSTSAATRPSARSAASSSAASSPGGWRGPTT